MLQAISSSSERAAASRMWAPGMVPLPEPSARAQEIAARREELMGMLRDLPESEYELSLTDLVETKGDQANGEAPVNATAPAAPPSEGKERSESGRLQAGRTERRGSAQRRDSPGSAGSFRSSSDGVLLNFYMPRSFTRSFTAPRPGRTTPSAPASVASSDCSKRERDADAETVKCWSLLWDRRWRKSSRREVPGAPPNESVIHAASAAILKAAKRPASPAKI